MLYLDGITLLDRDPLYRGAFTDIYHALYRGEEVALKRLRIFYHQKHQDRQRLRRVLSTFHVDDPILTANILRGSQRKPASGINSYTRMFSSF